jgi:hypothetical protein
VIENTRRKREASRRTLDHSIAMTLKKTILVSLLLTTALWLFFSWPLARYFDEGIPSSATNVEKGNVRRMIQGDHLQLLYNYWLFGDMLAGKTPFFHNLYEFNTGDDSALRSIGSGFDQPFTLFYAAVSSLGGRALGWNMTGLVSLWITHLFTWLLLRRYTRYDVAAALAALLAVALPYRWTSLLGGSPAGFAMMWIPVILWGLDSAIRQHRVLGGCVAGAAILFSYWNDSHVFFFSILMIPCWCVLVVAHDEGFVWRDGRNWLRVILALLPIVIAAGIFVVLAQVNQQEKLAGTAIADGRSFREVALYSPRPEGLFEWKGIGHNSQIYIGFIIPALLLAGFLAQLVQFFRSPKTEWRQCLFFALVLAGIACVILLSLGTRGPFDALPLRVVRKLLPPYSMIRQSAKIMVVLPPLLALTAILSLNSLIRIRKHSVWMAAAAGLVLLPAFADYGLQVNATVCLLDKTQPAYEAVAKDARAAGRAPRALILPLWPGDSSWASLYEHYVSLYRIRMINGYTPIVPRTYVDEIFNQFESANVGLLTDSQIAGLKQRGIDYILLHEDAFPEKVSWFPVGFTLKRLLNHPRLALLKQGENVWAFKLLDSPESKPVAAAGWNVFFPNFQHEMEWSPASNAVVLEASTASGGRFLRMADKSPAVIQSFEHLQPPDPILLVRCRGHGKLEFGIALDGVDKRTETLAADSDSWGWKTVPMGDLAGSRYAEVTIRRLKGSVDLDMVIYGSGRLPELAKGKSMSLPGALFFHAGYTELEKNGVGLRTDYEPADGILYGPKLPLTDGRYNVEMVFETAAPAGTELGYFYIEQNGARSHRFPAISGKPAAGAFSNRGSNLPITLVFVYSRNAHMDVNRFVFTRTE